MISRQQVRHMTGTCKRSAPSNDESIAVEVLHHLHSKDCTSNAVQSGMWNSLQPRSTGWQLALVAFYESMT